VGGESDGGIKGLDFLIISCIISGRIIKQNLIKTFGLELLFLGQGFQKAFSFLKTRGKG
jgi:hypothetical protein